MRLDTAQRGYGIGKRPLLVGILCLSLTVLAGACGEESKAELAAEPITVIADFSDAVLVRPVPATPTGTFALDLRVVTPGDATESSIIGDKPGGYVITYALSVVSIENPTGAFIHQAGPEESGPVVYTLWEDTLEESPFTGVLAEGTILESEFVGPMEGKDFQSFVGTLAASGLYVRVTTEENPEGELRAELGFTEEQRGIWGEYPYY